MAVSGCTSPTRYVERGGMIPGLDKDTEYHVGKDFDGGFVLTVELFSVYQSVSENSDYFAVDSAAI